MSYELVKLAARRLGLYRHLRLGHRLVFDRQDLRRFRAEVALYRTFIQPGDLCFDIGANYGGKTEVFLALGARVIAFEPQEDCYRELVSRNPGATAIRIAVGKVNGPTTLFVDPHRTGSSLRADWRESIEGTVHVPMTTFGDIVARYGPPAFCKVDVEGSEPDVIGGMSLPIPTVTFEFTRRRLTDALFCLDHLGRFGPFEANVTPEDSAHFISEHWWSPADARLFLERQSAEKDGYAWGDVFVRRRSS